jgi:hypothetical protein
LCFPGISTTVTTLTVRIALPAEIIVIRDSTPTTRTLAILDLKAVVTYAVAIMG